MGRTEAAGEPITLALTFVRTASASAATVLVSATTRTRWAEVVPLLPEPSRSSSWYAGAERVHGDHLLGEPPLLHTVELTDRPYAPPRRPLLELAVGEGPDAGQIRPLAAQTVLGRDPTCDIPVRDPAMSRAHVRIDVVHGRAQVTDLDSTNGSRIDDTPLEPHEVTELRAGQRLRTGAAVSRIAPASAPTPLPLRGGRRALSRPPRQVPVLGIEDLSEPHPPSDHATPIPWLVVLLPIPAGAILALFLRSPMFLAFAVFSPLMMVGHYVHDRFSGRRERRERWTAHHAKVAALKERREELLAREVLDRRRLAPDLAEVLAQAVAGRCWARRPGDGDHLLWRVGTGEVTAGVRVRAADGEYACFGLPECPVVVPLNRHRVAGLTGPPEVLEPLVDACVGQLVATHSPALLRLVVVSERATDPGRWGWLAWLPHARPDTSGIPLVLHPAEDEDQLTGLLGPWAAAPEDRYAARDPVPVHTVVLLHGQGLSQRPLLHELVRHGARHGVVVVAAAATSDGLPPDCTVTVELESLRAGRVLEGDANMAFAPDLPATGWCEQLAAALAPMTDTTPGAHGGEPPPQVRLLDLLDEVTADSVHRRWQAMPRSTDVLLGLGADGPVRVDLIRDGPHALVGGTTGSGKSELLQTLITSLALGNRPDELTFLLVDYKGGAAFTACVDLPHTVGLVTDLNPFQTRRALASLEAEIRRRERLLASVGAKDLPDYQRDSGEDRQPLPRLVLVIDEFRVLAEEVPDFLDGLVRIAAVGRSLGIHVVLATQRPAGIVSADIRANVNLRIALRVRDAADSEDIIDSPEAARISTHTPGRALLRTGAGVPVAVQTARVGGSPEAAATCRVVPVDAATGRLLDPPAEPTPDHRRDVCVIIESLRAAAELARVPQVPSPWLPPLSPLVPRASCGDPVRQIGAADGAGPAADVPVAPLGTLDVPDEQAQLTLGWSLPSGHLAIAGGPRSGRTTALRTLVAGLAERWSADDLHVYALDATGGLSALAALPHTGAVVGDDPAQVSRLVAWLASETSRRQQLLAGHDHTDLAEQRRMSQEPLPYVLVVLDGWEAFCEEHELADGALVDTFIQLLRDGAAVGVGVVVTGGRAVFSGRVSGSLTHRICLRMADEMDLVMAGLRPDQVPRSLPAGRGLVLPDGQELQLAVPGVGGSGAEQSLALRAVASVTPQPVRCPPKRFAGLPERVRLDELSHDHRGDGLVLGPAGEEAEPACLEPDPVHGLVALVAGPARSGRTSTLLTLAHQLRERGPILWLPGAGGAPGTAPWVTPVDGRDPDQLWKRLQQTWTTLVLDDVELLDEALDELACAFLELCGAGQGALLAAGSTAELLTAYRGVGFELRRRQSGILLQPGRGDGDLLGTQVPAARRVLPGRGALVRRARVTELQVALPPSDAAAA